MEKHAAVLSFLLILFPAGQTQSEITEKQIRAVENGLVPFTSPAALFQSSPPGNQDLKTLSDRMKHYKVPGVSIALVNDNRLEWAKAYGVLSAVTGAAVTPESIFQVASTSKFVTAVLTLHFVEKGILSLDEDVNTVLKTWKVPENEYTRVEKVTIRRLLTHRAGLPTTNFPHDEKLGEPSLLQVLKAESPARNKPAVPEFVPGSRWQYSNIGYDVVQLLLEDRLGKSFAKIAEETLFKPLGMNSTTFVYPLAPELRKKEALPHDEEGILREPSMNLTAVAHGGLMTTPADLARFTMEVMSAFQGKSERVLSRKTAMQLFRKEVDLDPAIFGVPLSEGLGVFLSGEGKNLRFAHPGSNLPGANCWLIGSPESGKAVVITTNGAQGEVLAMEIISAVMRVYRW